MDYSEMVKKLRNRRVCIQSGGGEDDFCLWGDAADAIEQLTAELEYTKRQYDLAVEDLEKIGWGEWIPVTERLPESIQSVLCYNEGGQWGQLAWIDIQTFVDEDGMSGFWHNRRYGDLVGQVTHWMPLPAPPKEET